jgi:hypothetical protein
MDRINQAQLAQAPEASAFDWRDNIVKTFPNVRFTKTFYSNKPALLRYDANSNTYFTDNRWYQYPKNVKGGTPTLAGSWKLENKKIVKATDAQYNQTNTTQTDTPPDETQTTNTQTTKKSGPITDQNVISGLTFDYTYPGDKVYVYAKKDNVWYGKNTSNNKVFNISQNYPSSAANLELKAVKGTNSTTSGTTTTGTTQQPDVSGEDVQQTATQQTTVQGAPKVNLQAVTAPSVASIAKNIRDMNVIELNTLKQNTPLLFNSMYNKLGAIERKKIDDRMAGKPV